MPFPLVAFFCQPVTAASAQNPLARGVEAMGGEAALGQLRTVSIRGIDVVWAVESSLEPGRTEPRDSPRAPHARFHPIQGDSKHDLVLADWRAVGGAS